MTNRQFIAWMEWLSLDREHPNRLEAYLMQIAAEVRRTRIQDPSRVDINSMRIKFETTVEKSKPTVSVAALKSRWVSAVGGKVVNKIGSKP